MTLQRIEVRRGGHRTRSKANRRARRKPNLARAEDEIIGYYALVVEQVEHAYAPERLTKGLARHPVPLMVLATLAVSNAWQGKGVGAGLLRDAMLRTLQAADIAGIRRLTVHAKDKEPQSFYAHFDMIPAPSDPFHLFILLKDVRAAL